MRPFVGGQRLVLLPFFVCVTVMTFVRVGGAATAAQRKRQYSDPRSRSVKFLNKSGAKVDFFWIHPHTRRLEHSHTEGKGVVWGGETGIHSFVGHEFEVIELEVSKGKCLQAECRHTQFQINDNEDQIFTLTENFEVVVEDNKSRSIDRAKAALGACQRDESLPVQDQIQKLADCMEIEVQKALNKTNDEIAFQAGLRRDMGTSLVQYACSDPKMNTTETFRNESWTFVNPFTKDMEEYSVQVLFETERTKVKYIPGMFSAEQCQVLLDSAIDTDSRHSYIPKSARTSMPIVQILMKLQTLYKSFMGLPVTFSSDPLLQLETYALDTNNMPTGECMLAEADETTDTCNIGPTSISPSTFVKRQLIQTELSDGSTGERVHVEPVHTSLLVLCGTGVDGGLHFPRTGTHIAVQEPGDTLLLIHSADTGEKDKEGYLDDIAICPPAQGEIVFAFHQVALDVS